MDPMQFWILGMARQSGGGGRPSIEAPEERRVWEKTIRKAEKERIEDAIAYGIQESMINEIRRPTGATGSKGPWQGTQAALVKVPHGDIRYAILSGPEYDEFVKRYSSRPNPEEITGRGGHFRYQFSAQMKEPRIGKPVLSGVRNKVIKVWQFSLPKEKEEQQEALKKHMYGPNADEPVRKPPIYRRQPLLS